MQELQRMQRDSGGAKQKLKHFLESDAFLLSIVVFYLITGGTFTITEFHTLFAWPNGIVTGNLLASAFWATPVLIRMEMQNRKRHRELKAQIGSSNANSTGNQQQIQSD